MTVRRSCRVQAREISKQPLEPPKKRRRSSAPRKAASSKNNLKEEQVDISTEGQLGAVALQYADPNDIVIPKPRTKKSNKAAKQEGIPLGEVFPPVVNTTKRPRRSKKQTVKNELSSDEDPSSPFNKEPSAFPSLSLRLHGLSSNRSGSFFGLVQELITPDVFGMVVVTILLNQTTGRAAIPVFYELMKTWPTPGCLRDADEEELREILRPIGLFNIRAKRLKELGKVWCEEPPRRGVLHPSRVVLPFAAGKGGRSRRKEGKVKRPLYPATEISHLPGVGRYALDSYLLFKPSMEYPEMASIQMDLRLDDIAQKAKEGDEKNLSMHKAFTSESWKSILARREEVGESRDVGRLLPPEEAEDEQKGPPSDGVEQQWRQVDPLDKELKAYRNWRIIRQLEMEEQRSQ